MSTAIDKLAEQYSALLLERMEQLTTDWKKPWITPLTANNSPRNIRGTMYWGGNLFFLALLAEFKNYKYPVWLTFKQAEDIGCVVQKGQKAAVIDSLIFWAVNKETKKIISEKEYRQLYEDEQKKYNLMSKVSYFSVFNISQTNMKEVKPRIWEKLVKRLETIKTPEFSKNYKNDLLDNVLKTQSWDCPIKEIESNRAYYSPLQELINMPLRTQFQERENFYSTLLHEMAHSTKGRGMNREMKVPVGIDHYGHEELIAELSSGLTSSMLGISSSPREGNISYLKAWIKNIKQDPLYIYNCMSDVKKITRYFSERLNISQKQDITLLEENDFKQKQSKGMKL